MLGIFFISFILHTGVQVLNSVDPSNPIVEGDQVTLTCRSKNKDPMYLAWRWLPAVSPPNQTIYSFMDINATHLPAGPFLSSLKSSFINHQLISILTGGIGYQKPFENETSDQEYPPPLGTFQVHRLKWFNIPMKAKGIYQCYDANNLNIPVSNITIDVFGNENP